MQWLSGCQITAVNAALSTHLAGHALILELECTLSANVLTINTDLIPLVPDSILRNTCIELMQVLNGQYYDSID